MSEAAPAAMAPDAAAAPAVGAARRDVSFPELVWAHFLRERKLRAEGSAARPYAGKEDRLYREFVQAFERVHGELDSVYWCSNEASAVAVTIKRGRLKRLLGLEEVRLHRVSDWLTKDAPDFSGLLNELEALAVRASNVLRGASRRIIIQRIMAASAHLLGIADAAAGKPSKAERDAATKLQREAMDEIVGDYWRAAARGAQVDYFWGMMLGVAVNSVVAFGGFCFVRWGVPWMWGFSPDTHEAASAFGCVVAGAVGALVSVMQRITVGDLKVDYEIGRSRIWNLGSYRPFIGAVSGLALYFALKAKYVDILPQDGGFFVFGTVAFLAGFSERFASDALLPSGGRAAAGGATDAQQPGGGRARHRRDA